MVKIPAKVFETLEEIRESGAINMLDYYGVQRIAYDIGRHDTVVWLQDNKKLYIGGVFEGFEVE